MANDTDAHFRAWAQEVHDALTAFGWVNTADTGQINLVTVSKPAGTSTSQGYEIWRMADSLQSLYACYMKIEYGSGTNSSNNPGIWITLGTGSNGTGTLTGTVGTRSLITQCNAYTTAAKTYYSSGGTARFCIAFGADAQDDNSIMYFGVERTKAADGTDSNEGMHMLGYGNDNAAGFCKFNHQSVPFTGSIPVLAILGTGDVPTSSQATGILGSEAYTYCIRPEQFYPRNAIMNWIVYYNLDFTREIAITGVDMYGASHIFMPLGSDGQVGGTSHFTQQVKSTMRLAMRYE